MLNIKFTNDNKIEIYTPYSRNFVKELKSRISDRKWDDEKKCWIVPAQAIDFVRELMIKHFGESDIDSSEKVTVILKIDNEISTNRGITYMEIFGKTIAKANGRDSKGRISADVVYLKGEYTSGGSAHYPLVKISAGSEIEIYNVSIEAIENMKDKLPSGMTYEIKNQSKQSKESMLLTEKSRLINRIKEIDKELEQI